MYVLSIRDVPSDGPALRASALIKFATLLLDRQPTRWESYVREELYDSLPAGQTVSIIKADLDFVVECWKERCFDLWEEVSAVHHFNYMVYIRALHDGAAFARRLGDTASADIYSKTLMEIQSDLERFWDEEKGYLLASINVKNDHGKVRWLDTGECREGPRSLSIGERFQARFRWSESSGGGPLPCRHTRD